MSWLDGNTKTIRAFTERALELAVKDFIYKREKKGEFWVENGNVEYHPAKAILYKPYSQELKRL